MGIGMEYGVWNMGIGDVSEDRIASKFVSLWALVDEQVVRRGVEEGWEGIEL